jgi:hypothetical protein
MTRFKFEAWPTEFKMITQNFGENPLSYAEHGLPGHEGLDFRATRGSKVFCVAPGTVRHLFQDNQQHAYGTNVRVQHEDGYETIYAHLQEAHVKEGQQVAAGEVLGRAGDSGNARGVHLHLTLKRHGHGPTPYPHNIVDPMPFVATLLDKKHDGARYVRDSVPDGTVMPPDQVFTQTWTLRNSGTTTWDQGYTFRHVRAGRLGAVQQVPLPPAPPNGEVPISVTFTAPSEPGEQWSFWQAHNANGQPFGPQVWVKIEVPQTMVSVTPDAFVQPRGREFWLRNQPFRCFGLNLRGLPHYGKRSSDPLKFSRPEHRHSQLSAAYNMGARVVRFFLADKEATPDEIEQRLGDILEIVKTQFPDLYLLPAFTNLYSDVPFHVRGDEKFFQDNNGWNLLNREFFERGYRENYLPLVERIVTAFRTEPNIFAWEIGNELKLDRINPHDANDPNPHLFIRFNLEVAAHIKRLDPNHMVTTGMKSTHHAWLHTPGLQEMLYTSPNIDFITIHSYEGMWDRDGDLKVYDDASLAARLNKPFLVEEAGFDIRVFGDRATKYHDHLQKWSSLGSGGYMPWGFIHAQEIGDGDHDVGVGVINPDFAVLTQLFRDYATRLGTASRSLMPDVAVDRSLAPAATAPVHEILWSGTVNATAGLRLRQGPGTDTETLAMLPHGSEVRVLADEGAWLHVESEAGTGYVHSDFVLQAGQKVRPSPEVSRAVLRTWIRFKNLLTEQAGQLNIDPAVAVAVLVTESGGRAFDSATGRMIIRFENHQFFEYWGKHHVEQFNRHFDFNRSPGNSWKNHQWRRDPNGEWLPCHPGPQAREWEVFEFARQLNEDAAIRSISMGAPQIMGFNHSTLGYSSPRTMFDAFQQSEEAQIDGLFRFIKGQRLDEHLRAGDFLAFARRYNGPGQADYYRDLILSYVTAFHQEIGEIPREPAVLEIATRGLSPFPTVDVAPRLPLPTPTVPGGSTSREKIDEEIYKAWRTHIEQGFKNNQTMFDQVLSGFMGPYWTTVWMYRLLFGVGILAFVAAIVLVYVTQNNPTTAIGSAAIFGGLGVVAFLSYFLSRPMQALEENLQFITWLGIIYNSYWTRLAYITDMDRVQEEIGDATDQTIARIREMLDKHTEKSGNRPGLR